MSPKPIYIFDMEIYRPKTGATGPFSRFRASLQPAQRASRIGRKNRQRGAAMGGLTQSAEFRVCRAGRFWLLR